MAPSEDTTAVYTSIFDDYDVLVDPQNPSEQIEYICFTDDPNLSSEVWSIRIIDDEQLSARLKNRKVKLLPHRYLPEFQASLYIDGNIQILGNMNELIKSNLSEKPMAVPTHPSLDCVYEEAENCITLGKGKPESIRNQVEKYRKHGFPKKYGMSDNSIIFRKHHNPAVVKTMEDWWTELKQESSRDQLSLPFVAWKNNLNYKILPRNHRPQSSYFRYHQHKPDGATQNIWPLVTYIRANRDQNITFRVLDTAMAATVIYRRKGLAELARKALNKYAAPVLEFADKYSLITPDLLYDESYYIQRKSGKWQLETETIAKTLEDEFKPNSVIDFGCAVGTYLKHFHELGVKVQGVEGNSTAIEQAVIPKELIDQHDLKKPYNTDHTYDLVLSIEVAEHIPEKYADTFVDTLVSAGSTVVLTAAPPGQGGTHHVNERPRDYWKQKFNERNMTYDEKSVASLQKGLSLETLQHVPENIFVFKNDSND